MSAKKKKTRPGYRAPASGRAGQSKTSTSRDQAGSGGLLRGLFSGPSVPAGSSPLPLYRESFARGAVVVGSSPLLLLAPLALVLALWLGELAGGYVGTPVPPLVNAFAVPPISTASSDAFAVFTLFGQRTGLYLVLPALIVRALITGLLAAAIVERFDTGRLSVASLLSAMKAFPIVLGMLIVGFIAIMFGQIVALLLGPGLGVLISYVVMPAFLVYALGFVPFVAVTE